MQLPLVIGRRECVDFPEWGIFRARVKIDTGAKTSAIDATIREVRANPDGSRTVVIELALSRRPTVKVKRIEAPLVKTVRVRCTSGETTERFVIETSVRLGPVTKRVRFTIADRCRMLVPVILGRSALAGDFLVDVSRKYISTT
jgi:hypothetical protein